MYTRGSLVENIEIDSIGNDGRAVGRVDGFVFFVEDAVPGDIADVLIYKKKKNFAEGRAVKISRPSLNRVNPFCQHFGTCGGCKWQHLSYTKQLEFKQQQVVDALTRIGHLEIPGIFPILGSEKIKYYRNKLEFTFSNRAWLTRDEMKSDARPEDPALGFHVPMRFDKILDIKTCYLQDERSNEIRIEVKNFCIESGLTFFDLNSQEGMMRNLIIRNTDAGEWMVVVAFHEAFNDDHIKLLSHLRDRFPDINSLQYVINPKKNDTISDLDIILFHGKDYIIEEMEGLRFRISAKSFYQTNSSQAYELYKIVRDFAAFKGNENVYDLYTGTGTIACFIAGSVSKVCGIDYIEDAIHDAGINADENGITNSAFFAGDIRHLLNDEFINKNGHPDVIITDPPRAGMHPDVVEGIRKAGPGKIVYVSCNPSTQARDLQLLQSDYRIVKIQPVDMFPHTSHVENVVLLEKK